MEGFAFFNQKPIWEDESFFSFSPWRLNSPYDDFTEPLCILSKDNILVSSPSITPLKYNSNRTFQYYYKDIPTYRSVIREREEVGKRILDSFPKK